MNTRRVARWIGYSFLAALGIVVLVLLLCTLLAAFRESHAAAERAPPTGRFVSADGMQIYLQESGPSNGRVVLFIHGTGAWSEMWRSQLDLVGSLGYHGVAIDVPPFGFSDAAPPGAYTTADQARRIIGVLDALNATDVILVGHSFGSRATVEAAMMQPQRVHALILIDAALGLNAPQTKTPLLLRPGILRTPFVAATVTNPLFTKKLLSSLISKKEAASPERVAMLQRPFHVDGATSKVSDWLAVFLASQPPSLSTQETNYASLHMPVLLIWGATDTLTPLDQGRHLAQLLPQAQLVVIPEVGHIPYIEDPAGTNNEVQAFLEQQ